MVGVENNTAVRIRHADHVAPSIRKNYPTSGSRSVGIVRSRTQATEFCNTFTAISKTLS
jgi:hypothetical protein